MKTYECIIICGKNVPAEKVTQITEKIKSIITGSQGEVILVNPWGKRRLAFPISGNTEGDYVQIDFKIPPDSVAKIENYLKITEDVIRHLIIKKVAKKQPPRRERTPSSEAVKEQPAVLEGRRADPRSGHPSARMGRGAQKEHVSSDAADGVPA
ncbi:MAG: 30S ribosomal protein S6 [Elusimicrobiota bacterium]